MYALIWAINCNSNIGNKDHAGVHVWLTSQSLGCFRIPVPSGPMHPHNQGDNTSVPFRRGADTT